MKTFSKTENFRFVWLTDDCEPPGGEGLVWVGGDLAAVEAGQGAGHVVQPEQEAGARGGQDLGPGGQARVEDVGRGPMVREEDLRWSGIREERKLNQ